MFLSRCSSRAAFTFLLAIFVCACSKDSKNPADSDGKSTTGDFKLGQTVVRTISAQPNQTIADSVTGLTILFPEGGTGTITTAPIVSPVTAPVSGEGYFIDYDRDNKVSLVFEPEDGDTYLVYGYGAGFGLSEDYENGKSWVSIPPRVLSDGKVAFDLIMPFEVAGKIGQRKPTGYQGFNHYWISHVQKDTPDDVKLKAYKDAAAHVCGYYLDQLPAAMASTARENILGSMRWNLSFGGDDYKGFFLYTPLETINSYSISIDKSYTDPAVIAGHIAHETGHYLFHVIGGNSAYMTVFSQMPWDTRHHGLGVVYDRKMMYIEEPAYFADYFMNGTVGVYSKPTEPKTFLYSSLNAPWKVDAPSIEGFGCVMLASLHRTADTIADIYSAEKGKTRKAPVIGADFPNIFNVMYHPPVPTNIDLLRQRIAEYLGAVQKERLFQPLMHGIGWSYTVKGRLEDASGKAIANARVKSVYHDGSQTWEGGVTDKLSAADGSFTVPWGVFGGKSTLRIYSGTDSVDVNIEIDWAKPTNVVVDRGTIKMEAPNATVTQTKTSTHANVMGMGQYADSVFVMTMNATLAVSGPGVKEVNGNIVAPLNARISGRMTATFNTRVFPSEQWEVGEPSLNPQMKMALTTEGSPVLSDLRSPTSFDFQVTLTTDKDGVNCRAYATVPLTTFSFDVDGKKNDSSYWPLSFTGPSFFIRAQ